MNKDRQAYMYVCAVLHSNRQERISSIGLVTTEQRVLLQHNYRDLQFICVQSNIASRRSTAIRGLQSLDSKTGDSNPLEEVV